MKNRATNLAVIPASAGNRNNSNGTLNNQSTNGNYWSSSVSGTNASNLNFNSTGVNPANTNNRTNGFSVRCLQYSPKCSVRNGGDPDLLLALFRAYFDTRKNKRSTANALAFEENYEQKIFTLYEDILHRRYTIGRSVCFIVDKPVKREVFAADFRDRIVHHLLFNWLNPIFEPHFIGNSYSCRKGKGTSAGIKGLGHFIRSCSENYAKECWVLKLDIKSYFTSMDRTILHTKIERRLRSQKNLPFDIDTARYLLDLVIFNEPTKNFVMRGKREDWNCLPKSKSLFYAPQGKGFPIGNLTSQLFSNIYLDDFDHFVREELGMERYGRYVDDMIFVHSDKEALKSLIPKVRDYLRNELGLELHPKKTYLQNAKKGVGFLGTFLKPWRTYIGKRTKRNFYARVQEWNAIAKENGGLGGKEIVGEFVASMNSYLGIMYHYNTYKLRKKILQSFSLEILKSVVFSSKNLEKVEVLAEKKKDEQVRAFVPSIFAQKSRAYIFIAMLFAGLAVQAVFPSTASAAYYSSGTVTSTNLISGSSASAITNFHYTLSSLPSTSSVTVQFSTDNTNWYSASGVLNGSNTLSTTGGADLALTGGWTGTAFYYKLTINATTDLTGTPVIDDVRLDYTATGGYGKTFVFSSAGNVGIGVATPTLGPLQMASGAYVTTGGTWTNASDRNLKENFTTMDPETILAKIATLPITQWNYKSESASTTHIGPVAQDFYAAFGLGGSDTSISTIDPAGVALLGIQALNTKFNTYIGSGLATTTSLVTLTATTTVTDQLCLAGDCRSGWPATASSTSPDLSGYALLTSIPDVSSFVSSSTLASAIAGIAIPNISGLVSTSTLSSYALLSNIPDVSSFVSTSTLASTLAEFASRSDLGNYALRSDLTTFVSTSTLASAIAGIPTPDLSAYATNASLASAIASLPTPDLSSYAHLSDLTSLVNSAVASSTANIPSASLSGTVTGSMIPNTDNAYTLGSPTHRFTDIYAKNVNAGDLTFTETTSAVSGNTLMPGDTIGLYVTSTGGTTHTVPIDFRTAINTTVYGANNIYFNTAGNFGIGVSSTTALRGKLDVEGAIASGNSSLLTLVNTSGANGNAAIPYSFYIPSNTGDLNIASNDTGSGALMNSSYSAWDFQLGGQSDAFALRRSPVGTQNYSNIFTVSNTGQLTIAGGFSVGGNFNFAQASTSQFSIFDRAYFGGTATTTIDSAGNILGTGQLSMGTSTVTNLVVTNTSTSTIAGNLSVTGNINLNGALLQNNAPFIGSQWTTSGSNLFYNTGNVGIGSSTPSTNFSVQGNQYTSGTAFFGGAITATSTLTLSALATPAGTFLAADANGKIIATTTPPSFGLGAHTWTGLQTMAGGINVPSGVLGYSMEGNLLAYASSTNQDTIFGLGAGGQNATTSAAAGYNTAIGYKSLNANTTGQYNTANGVSALNSNITGYANTANGFQSLYFNTTGAYNTANGIQALYSNTTGTNNTANGVSALYFNTTGAYNTANGVSALYTNTTGSYNTALGYQSLYNLTTGYDNIMLGHIANTGGNNITTGWNNILLGYNAGIGTTTSSSNFLNIGNSFFGLMVATSSATSLPTNFAGAAFAIATSSFTGNTLTVQNSSNLNNVVSFFSNAGASLFEINDSGTVGIASTTPFGRLSVDTSSLAAGVPSFVVGSSARTDLIVMQSGNVGIATTSPGYALDVAGSSAFGTGAEAMRIDSTGYVGIGTSTPYAPLSLVANTTSLIDLFAIATSTSGTVFKVNSYGQTFGDGAYTSPSADYAEYFYTKNTDLKSGEVVCIDPLNNNAVMRCDRGADNNVMGIVSTKPSVIGNNIAAATTDPTHYAIIGMMGQVEAYVSAENGPINVGDSLTSASTTPGVAMRAGGSDSTVGIALEPLASGTGQIKVLISRRNKSLAVEEVEALVVDRIANMKIEDTVQQLVKKATDNIVLTKLVVSGNVFASSYEMATTSVTGFTYGTTTLAAEIPSAVLTADGAGVDLYKLATYDLSRSEYLATRLDAQDVRITALETRMTALESGAVSSADGSPLSLSTTSLASAFEGLGAYISKGFAQFGTLIADRFVAATNSAGTSSAGTVNMLTGNTVAEVKNVYVTPTTKIFVTFNAPVTGSWYVSDKQVGSFRVVLSAAQTTDVSFDYFLVQTEGQVATSTPDGSLGSQTSGTSNANMSPPIVISSLNDTASSTPPKPVATTTPPVSSDTVAPVVTLNGFAAMSLTVGDTFTDLGATATDNVDGDLTASIVETGTATTTAPGTFNLTYSATDKAGNTGSASLFVTVIASTTPNGG